MSDMDKLFINLWEIDVRWGNRKREKLYLFQEKGQEKFYQKTFICPRSVSCFKQFCVIRSYYSLLTQVIQIRMVKITAPSSCAQQLLMDTETPAFPCEVLTPGRRSWKDCSLHKGKSSFLLFPLT